MTKQTLVRNIAAVSLIEIMMIFAIIGIVTAACMGLSKPKVEYMKKIRLYSALVTLEQAGKAIANEGSVFFTTDISNCPSRDADTSVCQQYSGNLKNVNNQLPTISHRAASTNNVVDPGLTTNTMYSSLTAAEQAQFKYLQDGLCQRLAHVLKLNDANINCSNNIDATGLINDSSSYQTNFYGITPQLYLPNGQVMYIGKNLYNDHRYPANGNITRNVVVANSNVTNGSITYSDAKNREFYIGTRPGNNFLLIVQAIGNGQIYSLPNETRIALLSTLRDNRFFYTGSEPTDMEKYLEKIMKNNKDYFIIYVDTDCKKMTQDEKKCGADTLNNDIFAFRMYRDGTVLPDYISGFNTNWLTAKILKRQANGRYAPDTDRLTLPYVHARCYANLAGTYAWGYANEHTGICGSRAPISDCISSTGESQCKVILNKPSFLMR